MDKINVEQKNADNVFDVDFIRSASKKMSGPKRRAFMAEVTLKYCNGSARKAEIVFGWGRQCVETGLGEKRTGIVCLNNRKGHSGAKLWEVKHPEAADFLRQYAESYSQQDPTFRSTKMYTRLTISEARKLLQDNGYKKECPPHSTMGNILNRMGFHLRKITKTKPQKKFLKPMQSLKT